MSEEKSKKNKAVIDNNGWFPNDYQSKYITQEELQGTSFEGITGNSEPWSGNIPIPPSRERFLEKTRSLGVEPEPDNNLPHEHQAHVDAHKSVIDNYEAYKLILVLTEILDEVRSINRKLKKRGKK